MRETKRLSSEEYEKAVNEILKIRIRKPGSFEAGYFTDWIRQKVVSVVGEEEFLNGGFTVKTTLDWSLQQKAESAISIGSKEIDRRQGFQGALKNIKSKDEIREADLATRKQIFEEGSDFLLLLTDGETAFEYKIDETENEKIENFRETISNDMDSDLMIPGYYPQDRAVPLMKAGKSYQAVVHLVQDKQKIIYLSIGGVSGFIPHEGFKWAHPRKISDETSSEFFISRPSEAVKEGDVVWVSVKDTGKKVWDYIDSSGRSTMKNPKLTTAMKTQLFVRCDLDQDARVQSALVAMDSHTGEILSLVGGTNFEKSQFNRAIQSLRQPGSSFKPFIYAAALENGHTPASILVDTPEALVGVDDTLNWKPSNYDGVFKGRITLRRAMEESRNVPTIRLANEVGMRKVQLMAERFGLKVNLANDLSAALGSFGITLLDLVTAYSIFPNGGQRIWPKAIVSVTDRTGKAWQVEEVPPIPSPAPSPVSTEGLSFTSALGGNQVYDSRLAHLMVNLMRGVIQNGTGQRARGLGPQVAGKTGTTNNHIDAWFLGFSPTVTVGVWAGFDDNSTLGYGETGAKTTLPMWIDYMREALKKYPDKDFVVPEGIVNVLIDEQTGKPAGGSSGPAFLEAFVEGTEPGGAHQGKDQDVSPLQSPGMPSDDDYFNQQ
jgi:penicillin-binding protein 1A